MKKDGYRRAFCFAAVALGLASFGAGTREDGPPVTYVYAGEFGSEGPGLRFGSISDIAVAPDGKVWVRDVVTATIRCFSAEGSLVIISYQKWVGLVPVLDSLAVAANGDVYVEMEKYVGCYDERGKFVLKLDTENYGDFHYGVSGMAVAPNGFVYITDSYDDRVLYFAPDGSYVGAWGSEGTGEGEFGSARGIAVAPNGRVYVADGGNERVQYFTPQGEFVGAWGSEGKGEGQFYTLADVAVAPDGTVYTVEKYNHRVQYFTAAGAFLGEWGGRGSAYGEFYYPSVVAVAPSGRVYVGEDGNGRVQYFTAEGGFLGAWGSKGSRDGLLVEPSGVAVAPNGDVYVADKGNNRLQKFTSAGSFMGKRRENIGFEEFMDIASRPCTEFWAPEGVAVGPGGEVYVVDTKDRDVVRLTDPLSDEDRGTSFPTRDLDLTFPADVAVAPDGRFYVALRGEAPRIRYFDASGSLVGEWGAKGLGEGEFRNPYGVGVGPDGTVYVADTGNHRIQYFTAAGSFLGQWGVRGTGRGEFNLPAGVDITSDGIVFVADGRNHRVQYFTSTGRFLGKWGNPGRCPGEFYNPYGVAVGPNGYVYVVDSGNDRVQYFRPFPRGGE